jgi:hypothetical protein
MTFEAPRFHVLIPYRPAHDIGTCEYCGAAVKVIACIEDAAVMENILAHLQHGTRRSHVLAGHFHNSWILLRVLDAVNEDIAAGCTDMADAD